ncbi:hypothetical protein BGZ65_002972 [Modicella reniformis]|uniref:Uncharacterized protein n=1 Tax=Modicella reniformis TaxID=1440133 RepID=A0A9P6MBX3_9FUNG|nr:hypothetical protein BGZ65_002972 [Modicella reniformis]
MAVDANEELELEGYSNSDGRRSASRRDVVGGWTGTTPAPPRNSICLEQARPYFMFSENELVKIFRVDNDLKSALQHFTKHDFPVQLPEPALEDNA